MNSPQIANYIRKNQALVFSLVWEELANDWLDSTVAENTIPVQPH